MVPSPRPPPCRRRRPPAGPGQSTPSKGVAARAAPGRGHGEAGGVQHDPRVARRPAAPSTIRRHRLLQALAKIGSGLTPRSRSAAISASTRRQVAGLQQRPVEHDGRDRAPPTVQCGPQVVERRDVRRPANRGPARSRGRGSPIPRVTDQVWRRRPGSCAGVLRAAVDAVLPDTVGGASRQRRVAQSSGSGWSSPGRRASAMPLSRQSARSLLDAVGPVADAAQQAHDDQLGVRR